jgi:hypothetical protein
MFKIIMQFIPGNDQIWVEQINPTDPIYQYNDESEAQAKAEELQSADATGRLYRVDSSI